MTRRKPRTVAVKVPAVATEPGAIKPTGERKQRFRVVEVVGASTDSMDQWAAAGFRLLEVDPDRFRRYLGAAQAIVELYESSDPDRTLAEWLPMLGARGGEA